MVWPWVRDHLLQLIDPASRSQCSVLVTLIAEAQEMCSEKIAKTITSSVFSHIERVFSEHINGICMPLLKLGQQRWADESKSDDLTSGSVEFARSYSVHQVQRMCAVLQNLFLFRHHKMVKAEVAAISGWRALVEQALPSSVKLLKAGTIEVIFFCQCITFEL